MAVRRERRLGGAVAVGAAAAVLAVCAAGGPLYVSSAASRSVQVQLDDGCVVDDGMRLSLVTGRPYPRLDSAARAVDNVTGPPIVTTISQPYLSHRAGTDEAQRRVILAHRDGQADQLGPEVAQPGPGEVVLPEWYLPIGGVAVGDRLALTVPSPIPAGGGNEPVVDEPDTTTIELTVAGTYPEIPVRPEPSYWCGLRSYLRPNTFGDPPPPLGLVDSSTLDLLPPDQQVREWELRPDSSGLTRNEARRLSDDFVALTGEYEQDIGVAPGWAEYNGAVTNGLPAVTAYAAQLSEVVSRTVAPVRTTGLAASTALLAAAGVLLAREHRRDLRLRLLKGVGPVRLAGRMGRSATPAVVLGSAVGAGLALLAVVTAGPTPELEGGALVRAALATVLGAALAVAVVAVGAAVAANRTVDARPRRSIVRWLVVPLLIAVVAVTGLSIRRLDRVGGVRLVGSEPQGGDLLAQAFPLLAIAAPILLLAPVLVWGLRRVRFAGRALPPAAMLGVRRVLLEPVLTVMLISAIALASGTYVAASALTASAEHTLDDKAGVFLGTDLVVITDSVVPLPPSLADRATIVQRSPLRSGDYGVDLLGVDRATFARAVTWRSDATGLDLDDTLDAIRWDGQAALPAVVVGRPLDDLELRSAQGDRLQVEPVVQGRFFPGFRNGAALVVVDRDALAASGLGLAEEVWVHDPPSDTADALREAGITARSPRERADVFDVASFLTVRWAYGALAAFGLLVAVVVVIAQLLVLDARRRSRQAAFVLTRPMGHRAGDEAVAILMELVLPMLVGVVLGAGLAVGVSRFAIPRLDTLRQLAPPARVVVPMASFVPMLLGTAVALAALTALGVVSVVRARPMEVMRATA